MITNCPGCQTRYRLDDAKVPRRRIRVRCPRCEAVFQLDGAQAAARVAAPAEGLVIDRASGDLFPRERPAAVEPAAAPAARPVRAGVAPAEARPAPAGAAPETAPAGPSLRPSVATQPASPAAAPTAAATLAEPAAEPEAAPAGAEVDSRPRRDRDKARRLARALVSDILVYNRELRDRSLREGNLIQALGPEIKKSWELYKEKVTPEVANSTSHFRDALNEILAEGQKVF